MSEYEPEPPAEQGAVDVDPELLRQRQAVQLEVWKGRQLALLDRERAQLEALNADPSQPQTMTQRLAAARALVLSNLVPAGFRGGARGDEEPSARQIEKGAASIVLAQEWGRHLGLEGLACLQHLQVVEGNLGLKPASARGFLLAAGYRLKDETVYNRLGFPVGHRVEMTRDGEWCGDGEFTVQRAARAGLVELVLDTDGEVTAVKARSKGGKALPWELYTEDLLRARATSRLISAYAMHLTGGLNLAGPEDPYDDGVETTVRPVAAAVRQIAERLDPATRERVREHYEQEQQARTAEAVTQEEAERAVYDPYFDLAVIQERHGAPDGRVPWWEHAGAQARGVRRRSKVEMAADRIQQWAASHMAEAFARNLNPPAVGVPVLLNPEPGVEHPAADAEPVDAQEWYDPEYVSSPEPLADVPEEADPEELRKAQVAPLLAEINLRAKEAGAVGILPYMHAWIVKYRKAPEQATPEELEAFLDGTWKDAPRD